MSAPALNVELPPQFIEAIAQRVAELLAERQAPANDGWLRGAEAIAAYIGAPRSRVYALSHARRIPVHKDGSVLVARRFELDDWIRGGGGRRP